MADACDGVLQSEHFHRRIGPAAEQPDAADRHGDLALVDVVAADGRVAVLNGVLELDQREAEFPQQVGIGLNFVAPDRPAPAADVDDSRHRAEFALQHPVLQGLQIVERVDLVTRRILGRVEHVAVDFASRRFGRDLRSDAIGQRLRDRRQPVDDLLPARLVGVIAAVVPVHLEVAQAVERLAANRIQPGHAGEGDFQRDGDLAFDFFGRRTGELGEDFDDGRSGIGVRLDVDVEERIHPDDRQRDREENDDERVVQCPLDQFANHQRLSEQSALCSCAKHGARGQTRSPWQDGLADAEVRG